MTAPKKKLPEPFDAVTLDHLRVLVAVAESGSFSAAAREIGRVQSAISQAMASLEESVGFKIWDRTDRAIALTDRGRRLLGEARRVLGEIDRMRDAVKGLRGGKREKLSLCVEAVFPPRALVALVHAMEEAFPGLELRIETDTLGAIAARVARREADVGIAGPVASSKSLERIAVGSVLLVPACAPSHPLAALPSPIPVEQLRAERQIVLSERGEAHSPDQAVLSDRTWRVVDLSTKRELIAGGLGWGNLPVFMMGPPAALVQLDVEAWNEDEHRLPLGLVFPPGLRSRPIVRWLLGNLPPLCASWGVGLPPGSSISAGDG
jgi:DNA-binding transcriptional LysR family regulator